MKAEGGDYDSGDEHGYEQGSEGEEWLGDSYGEYSYGEGSYGEDCYGEDCYGEVVSSWGAGHDEPDEDGGEWGEPEY